MKNYELTVVFHPDLEMNIDPALDKVKKVLEANHANVTKEEVDGKKRLAYKIGKQDFGIYYYFELELPPEAPAKIEAAFNISDEILRQMLVRADERKAKLATKRAERAAKLNAEANEANEADETDEVGGADTIAATTEDTNPNQEEA